jgi:hypothetical protein
MIPIFLIGSNAIKIKWQGFWLCFIQPIRNPSPLPLPLPLPTGRQAVERGEGRGIIRSSGNQDEGYQRIKISGKVFGLMPCYSDSYYLIF